MLFGLANRDEKVNTKRMSAKFIGIGITGGSIYKKVFSQEFAD